MVERQVIVTWYTPEEKIPKEDIVVLCTISGKTKNMTFNHALAFLMWSDKYGWYSMDYSFYELDVIAWCDMEPYKG